MGLMQGIIIGVKEFIHIVALLLQYGITKLLYGIFIVMKILILLLMHLLQ